MNPVYPEDKGIYVCTMKQNKGTDTLTRTDQTIKVFVLSKYIIKIIKDFKT